MLERLELANVGPAPTMTLELAPRINLITGDNGLGKSFLLDVAWWALTRKWPRDLNPSLTAGYPFAARAGFVGSRSSRKSATGCSISTCGTVRFTYDEVGWAKQGDVINWLVSETFGLRQGRSVEAERAIEAAEALMRDDTEGPSTH